MNNAQIEVLAPHSERAYAIMRIVVGLLFSFHGMQKVLGFMVAQPQPVCSACRCSSI